MKIDLTGKVALVTGSTGGIGFAVAKGLAETGATVVVQGRTSKRIDDAIGRLQTEVAGASLHGIAGDVGSAEGCAAIVKAVPMVDILINNAGIFEPSDFFDTEDDVWDRHWAVNVMSGVRLSRAYAPMMQEHGWGRIIFLASESAFNIPVEMIHYGVSKTADVAVARGLAKRLADTGVTVNSVLPGPTLTEGVEAMLKDSAAKNGHSIEEEAKAFVMAQRPSSILQRAATVDEVASMIVYLSSKQASATTGAAVRVDGGVIDSL